MKRFVVPVLAALLLAAACGGGGGGGGGGGVQTLLPPLDPAYTPTGAAARGDVFVHLFEWRWADIAKECETFLGPNGYAGVQISPPSEHAVIATTGSGASYPWWQRYQTVSYSLAASRSGDLTALRDMIGRCHAAGVKIYADAVINHMTAGSGTGSANSAYSKYSYPAVPWTADNFHTGCSVVNYGDAANVQLCELSGLADLRTEDDAVRKRIADYLIALQAEGVDGFRIDAAKHMQPRDIDTILAKVNAAATAAGKPLPYVFLEVINNAGEAVTAQQYFGVGHGSGGAADLTDFQYGYAIRDAFLGRNGKSLASLQGFETALLPSDKSVVFVDNHDTQRDRNANGLYYASGNVYELATIFMLAYPQGAPSVMSSYGFVRGNDAGEAAGPPSTAGGMTQSSFDGAGNSLCTAQLGSAQSGSWICEHRRRAIAAMVAFRKSAAGAPVVGFRTFGDNNRIAFERDGLGYVAINNTALSANFVAQTLLPSGNYCNVAVDGYDATARTCSGTTIGVANGTINLNVPANGAVVLHVGATTN